MKPQLKINSLLFKPVIFFSLLLNCQSSFSQQYSYRKFDLEQGLAGTSVYRVAQDTQSYLWFATDNGVSRFDGHTFTNFTSKEGFQDYGAYHIEKDSHGRLWFLPFNGKICYLENGKFRQPDFPGVKEKDISWMMEDSKGNFWFTDKRGYVLMYNGKSTVTYRVKGAAISLVELPNGRILLHQQIPDSTFAIIDPVSTKISPFHIKHDQGKISFPRFLKLRDKRVLISTSEGIYIYALNNETELVLPFIKNVFEGEVISMYEEDNKDIWIGNQDGVRNFPGGNFDLNKATIYLPANIINSSLKDHEGNYWFTSPTGVFNLRSKSVVTYSAEDGLNINEVRFCAKSKDGDILIVLLNGHIYSLKNGKLKKLEHEGDKLQPLQIKDLTYLKDGKIRITSNKFELILNGNSIKLSTDPSDIITLYDNYKNQEWYYGTTGPGKIKDNKKIPMPIEMLNTPEFYAHMCMDKNMDMWVGGKTGLYIINSKGSRKMKYENELYGKNIIDLKRDKDGNVWVATKGNGIYTIINGSIINFTSRDGLLSDYCNSLLIDKNDNIYVSSNFGVNKLIVDKMKKLQEVRFFNKSNSLVSNEVNSIFKDGEILYVSTKKGLTVLDENTVKSSSTSPPVYITRLLLDDRDTSLGSFYDLDYGISSMQISYTGISFSSDGNIHYRYKMLPLDTGWKYTPLSSLEYSSLAPGKYEFYVSAQNSDGIWSMAPATLPFHIKTPYWQTWWFRTLVIVSLMFVLFLIFYIRLKNSKNKSALKRKLIEAELMALRAQMNPHFIFNALNAIQDFILKNDKENANMYLSKFAGLIRVIMENSKRPFISLNDEIKFLNLYLEIETVRFNHKFSYYIDIDPSIDRDKTKIPSMILQPYIENSIRHGLAAKTGKGNLLVKISANKSQLNCTIEDDGIGRKVSVSAKKSATHISRGMETTYERLRLLNKDSDLNMNVELIDLADDDGNPSGTKVLLTFPAESDF